MANKGFICLDGYLKRTAKLSDQELGRLFRACMIYHATGELSDLTGRESVAFDFIREDIDAANEAYAAKCETNRRNRMGTIDNDRQRPSTTVIEEEREESKGHETPNKNKNKNEKEKIKENDNSRAREVAERFDRFWAAYPRHEGKKKAEESFRKIGPDETLLDTILAALAKWKQSDQWNEDGGRYIPYPATWLNGKRWEDELPSFRRDQKPAKTVIAQQYSQRDYSGQEESMDDMIDRLMAMQAGRDAGGES